MARLDHAGMHRPHGHFVDLVSGYGIIVVAAGNVLGVVVAEDIFDAAVVGVIADHLEPRMAFGSNAVLLGDFPFEHVKRLAPGGKGRIGFRRIATGHKQAVSVRRTASNRTLSAAFRIGEKLNNLAAVGDDVHRPIGKIVERQAGECSQWVWIRRFQWV